jgi:peptidoglycan hydrolase FlgJ
MTTKVDSTSSQVYGDFAGLEKLKSGVRGNDAKAIRQVAQQFESLFARMMIKSMRDAIGKDPIFGSDSQQMYQGMFDNQLSLELTKGRGLGLSDMLMRQLQHAGASGATSAAGGSGGASSARATSSGLPAARTPTAAVPTASAADQASFVRHVWPHAEQAGAQLGVNPVSLVAQAALETNWGRSMPHGAAGSSNNLFGIKAGSSWNGSAVSASTQEFTAGASAATATTASFRSYASAADSFQDYVALLRSNPRFSGALNQGDNVAGFASALQRGGYATDPRYAHKVTAVAQQVIGSIQAGSTEGGSLGDSPLQGGSIQAPSDQADSLRDAVLKFASAVPIKGTTGTL